MSVLLPFPAHAPQSKIHVIRKILQSDFGQDLNLIGPLDTSFKHDVTRSYLPYPKVLLIL